MKNLAMVLLLTGALLAGCGGKDDKPTQPSGVASIDLSVSSLTMDSTKVGSSSQKTLTISNTGSGSLAVSGLNVTGGDAGQFAVSPPTTTVAPGARQAVKVTFTPASAGVKSASLSITHNAAGSPTIVALSGTGTVDVAAISKVLVETMKQAFLSSLISDTTSVAGTKGSLQIAGDNWNFVGYSPDGKLTIDGALVVEKAKYPEIPVKGTLTLSGSQVGPGETLVVDMLVKVIGLEITSTGTLNLEGTVYDVADLIAAGSASG